MKELYLQNLNQEDIHKIKKYNKLIFSNCFNQELFKIPDNIEEIIFGEYFNHPIHNNESSFLSSNLKSLKFGEYFNQSINIHKTIY